MSDVLGKAHEYARSNYIPILDDESLDCFKSIVQKYMPKSVLEIGTAIGYSASLIAQICPCFIDTVELNQQRVDMAKQLWKDLGIGNRITSYVGDVDVILQDIVEGKEYDFVFLDGPKSRYGKHLEICYPHIKKGGIIVVDDVLFFGMVMSGEKVAHKHRTIVNNLRKFVKYINECGLYKVTIMEKGNGIAVLEKL